MDKNVILAKKYGRAIYEIAAEQNSLEKTEEELHLIADAIKEWCSKMNIEQGERTDEEMINFINEYDYEDDETYFYIRTFTFE